VVISEAVFSETPELLIFTPQKLDYEDRTSIGFGRDFFS
jgi:hypothetical protein